MKNQDDIREEHQAQAQSDAAPGAVADGREDAARTRGDGSDANGVAASAEAAGDERKRLYKETGSPLVSRID